MYNEYTSLLTLFKIDSFVHTTNSLLFQKYGKYFCCHIQHLHSRFEVLFTKNNTCQVSVDGFKVSVVHLKEVSVL